MKKWNNITEKVYFECFRAYYLEKKRENGCKAVYIGKQKDITRNVYNESFIVSQEPQGKKRKKKLLYM